MPIRDRGLRRNNNGNVEGTWDGYRHDGIIQKVQIDVFIFDVPSQYFYYWLVDMDHFFIGQGCPIPIKYDLRGYHYMDYMRYIRSHGETISERDRKR